MTVGLHFSKTARVFFISYASTRLCLAKVAERYSTGYAKK